MPNTRINLLNVFFVVGLAGLVVVQQQSRVRLRKQNEDLSQQLTRSAGDRQRLSHLVSQASVVESNANNQFQELLKLRTELAQLRKEREDTNRVAQTRLTESATDQVRELTGLRTEVGALFDEISSLREDIQDLYATLGRPAAEERATGSDTSAASRSNGGDTSISIRTIPTRGDSFAEKLKRTASAQDAESFQEVFGRFLQLNGVNTTAVAGLVYDERTGRVIVRAPQAVLDQIERLTIALDASQ